MTDLYSYDSWICQECLSWIDSGEQWPAAGFSPGLCPFCGEMMARSQPSPGGEGRKDDQA